VSSWSGVGRVCKRLFGILTRQMCRVGRVSVGFVDIENLEALQEGTIMLTCLHSK